MLLTLLYFLLYRYGSLNHEISNLKTDLEASEKQRSELVESLSKVRNCRSYQYTRVYQQCDTASGIRVIESGAMSGY